ncbi:hypothetical protein SAMN04487981_10828 [Streptomyces sp. cf386]|uniref:hypothetical protein n=1 Tax=Streptomyces sp. cf386 TaxID=1761904 RepID=UPI000885B8BA|nr:hypothetical protein [Streptomyces sp. cf386]SDO03702.1 hypothetical protein SAMN04487981_10828 [Streptomyces sp. cf386]
MELLATLGTTALSEGIRFLFDQARVLLDRRRGDQEGDGAAADESGDGVVRLPPEAFAGTLDTRRLDEAALTDSVAALRQLRTALFPFVDDADAVQPGDAELLQRVDQLRRVLEAVYGQRITFVTEVGERPASGTVIDTRIDIDEINAEVIGVSVGRVSGGSFSTEIRSKNVGPGGRVVGFRADSVGGPGGDGDTE